MPSIEKRVHARYDVEHDVEITRDDVATAGRMVNLSRGGTMVTAPMDPPLKMGERVGVGFMLPDLDTPLRCKADVRWLSGVDKSMVGLQFTTGLRAKETWALGRFLDRLRDGAET